MKPKSIIEKKDDDGIKSKKRDLKIIKKKLKQCNGARVPKERRVKHNFTSPATLSTTTNSSDISPCDNQYDILPPCPEASVSQSCRRLPSVEDYVALDCEFVGVGSGRYSALGRCSVIDYHGNVLLDVYSKPSEPITDYRTRWSGIRPKHLMQALPFDEARALVVNVIRDKIVVGHAVHHDFAVLRIQPPRCMVRDTSRYKPLRVLAATQENHPPSLKNLALKLLKRSIQTGEHSSVVDSRATMDVFKLVRHAWERSLLQRPQDCPVHSSPSDNYAVGSQTDSTGNTDCSEEELEMVEDVSYLSDQFWPDN